MNPSWLAPASLKEAAESQKEMAHHLLLEDALPPSPSLLCGLDTSCQPFDPEQRLFAAAVLLSYTGSDSKIGRWQGGALSLNQAKPAPKQPGLKASSVQAGLKLSGCPTQPEPIFQSRAVYPGFAPVETQSVEEIQTFPYVPGFLGFREAPALVHAVQKLSQRPHLLLIDGHGVSHPRRLGIASHLGLLLDLPTIGVAKSILVGHPLSPLGEEVGSETPLVHKGEVIGMLLRSRKRALPLIISAGHKISLPTAVSWVKRCLTKYRLPEPTRRAHLAANEARLLSQRK